MLITLRVVTHWAQISSQFCLVQTEHDTRIFEDLQNFVNSV